MTNFSTQSYILAKNPYYWQPLAYDGIKVPSFVNNDAAALARVNGELDWTGNFVANIDTSYVAKDPAHFHYYFAHAAIDSLWFDNTMYPFSLPDFRKAISMAINRQQVAKIGESGYAAAASASGIELWPAYADPSLAAQNAALAAYNPTAALALLTKDGFTTKGGQLYDPKGNQVSLTLSVIGGWSDWVLSLQIIQANLKKFGINASIKLYQQPEWISASYRGTLPGGDGHFQWTNSGVTPYEYFFGFLSKESFVPIGSDASLNGQTNWSRYASPEATALLAQFRQTTDMATQVQIAHKLEAIQLRDMPAIPIFAAADWYEYSTLHFTGWPTKDNFYTDGSPNDNWNTWKVLTTIKPVSS